MLCFASMAQAMSVIKPYDSSDSCKHSLIFYLFPLDSDSTFEFSYTRAVERISWAVFYELLKEKIILKPLLETVLEAKPPLFPPILGGDGERRER